MTSNHKVSAARLRELLRYDAKTGVFIWVKTRGRTAHAGMPAGTKGARSYVEIMIDGRSYNAHRLAWLYVTGEWPQHEIDHIDGVRDNNAFANLRDVQRELNMQNRRHARADSQSGVPGVRQISANSFQATISVGGKTRYLGAFRTAELAHGAFVAAKRDFHPGCTL